MDYMFKVQLDVPLGIRNGKMIFHINNNKINGALSLLGSTEAFEGVLMEDGMIRITGILATPIRRISYEAIGRIKNAQLDMKIYEKKNCFQLTGSRIESTKEG